MKYLTFLNEQIKRAESVGLEKEAIRLLILEILELNNVEFIVKLHDEISDEAIEKLTKAIDKYIIDKIPVQYIMGYAYFYGNKLKVNENVLIPRCETEELVEYVRSYYEKVFSKKTVDIVDIGTGSGAIAVTIQKESNAIVSAVDISKKALKVAKRNAKNNKANRQDGYSGLGSNLWKFATGVIDLPRRTIASVIHHGTEDGRYDAS